MPSPSFVRRQPPELWLLFVGRVITAAGFSFSFPFFALYASDKLKVSGTVIGLTFFARGVVGGISRYFGGELADRLGRKIVMQTALAGRAVTSAAITWEIWAGKPFAWIAATFIASDLFGQLFEPSSQAYVSDMTSGRARIEGFGLVRMGINAGWALGLVLHGFLTQSYVLAFGVTAGVFTLSLTLFTLFLHEKPHTASGRFTIGDVRTLVGNRQFRTLCLSTLLVGVVASQLVPSTSIYVTRHVGLAVAGIPFLIALNGGLVFLLQIPASRWIDTGLVRALVVGAFCYAAGYGSYALGTQYWHFALCILAVTCGEILAQPAATTLASEMAPDAQRGRYLGVFGLANNFGWSLGPALGGSLLDLRAGRSPILWLALAAIASLAAAGFSSIRFRRPDAHPAPEPVPVAGASA
ncbi:MAG: MFS transporter [Planctomycetes bacterium]|nr:MFS transporter [Planctomycetota bacterium]